jgi:hypothetical protein
VSEVLYGVDLRLIAGALVLGLLAAEEAGYRIGRRQKSPSDAVRSQTTTIESAILGLLALLLGFTFAMSLTRFDRRKTLVLKEADAIDTARQRAQLLPPADAARLTSLLKTDVDARIALHEAGPDATKLAAATGESSRLEGEMWTLAVAHARKKPDSMSALVLAALNEVSDADAERVQAIADHVPEPVLDLLILAALIALGVVGYASGLAGRRILLPKVGAAVLISAAILLIMDLDRPTRGLIVVDQSRMLELRDSFARP